MGTWCGGGPWGGATGGPPPAAGGPPAIPGRAGGATCWGLRFIAKAMQLDGHDGDQRIVCYFKTTCSNLLRFSTNYELLVSSPQVLVRLVIMTALSVWQ